MKYYVINEELKIANCRIADLTKKQLEEFSNKQELTLFYDKEKDLIVLNRDNENYFLYLDMVESYLVMSSGERCEMLEKSPKNMKKTLEVLNNVLINRRNNKELFVLEHQYIDGEYSMNYSMYKTIKERFEKKGETWLMFMSLNYGLIQGKRGERARRKRSASSASVSSTN